MVADTIAAIATPLGEGGICIIRISGPSALAIADRLIHLHGGRLPSTLPSHTVHYGQVNDPLRGITIDGALLLIMASPNSYTGEDTVEIQGHGGVLIARAILETALQAGARLAEPGEFTRRAFMNGRLDLTQAEAVLQLIQARSETGRALAWRQFQGGLKFRLSSLRNNLLQAMAQVEAFLDFEDDLPPSGNLSGLAEVIEASVDDMRLILKKSRESWLFQFGAKVVIVGRPNVGKSSLLNALLEEPRAIVTALPGTTRDIVNGWATIKGIPVNLIDCAGIREPGCLIEEAGIKRALVELEQAHLILFVVDMSQDVTPEDRALVKMLDGRPVLAVGNKKDLPRRLETDSCLAPLGNIPRLELSCITLEGLDALREKIACLLLPDHTENEPAYSVNIRQSDAIRRSSVFLEQALVSLRSNLSLDIIAADLRQGLEALGEVTGVTATEDILDAVFNQFCVGK